MVDIMYALIITLCVAGECAIVDPPPKYKYKSLEECLSVARLTVHIVPPIAAKTANEVACKAEEGHPL